MVEFWCGAGFGFLSAVIVLIFVFGLFVDSWYAGDLREDRSNPEEPYYFMEVAPGRGQKLSKNRKILLKVKRENYIDTK